MSSSSSVENPVTSTPNKKNNDEQGATSRPMIDINVAASDGLLSQKKRPLGINSHDQRTTDNNNVERLQMPTGINNYSPITLFGHRIEPVTSPLLPHAPNLQPEEEDKAEEETAQGREAAAEESVVKYRVPDLNFPPPEED
ncbi:hypothetical protein HAX54_045658 [Datura stramonium]|uniref:Uncharacterized protein n=1 Tax=Datura stramonium TaxID=4076 RepID=A0ABS8RSY7_DATST|nr:hypothetical protein [Datura stramonium]